MTPRWLSRFATWTPTDTAAMLWACVIIGVFCVVNMIAARSMPGHLLAGLGVGMFAGALLLEKGDRS